MHFKLYFSQSVLFFLILNSFQVSNAQIVGEIWGTTTRGGSNDYGVIFKAAPDGSGYSVEFSFNENGIWPRGGLIQATDGLLYGLTSTGKNGSLLFSFSPATKEFTEKYVFNKPTEGYNPRNNLIQAKNGKLYGVTYLGGINDAGVLFEYDLKNGTYAKKFDFGGANGAFPHAGLTEALNGKLYGSTLVGGLGYGVLFEYDTSTDTFQKVVNLDDATGGQPLGSLVEAAHGKLYGTTNGIGGVLFELDINSRILTKRFSFKSELGSGGLGLVMAKNRKLYGMTTSFGGTLFEFDPITSVATKKLDFAGTNGSTPYGTLMLAENGNLYGVTYSGGESSSGVLFEYNVATNALVKKFDFSKAFGSRPEYVQLIQYREKPVVTGLIDLSKKEKLITVFPNPAKDKISIHMEGMDVDEAKSMSIDILNPMGEILNTKSVISESIEEISVLDYPNGTYLAKIALGGEVYVRRFVKQ